MKKIIFFMICLSILNVCDAVVTYNSINFVRAEEINPLMNFLIDIGWQYFFIFKIGIMELILCGFLLYIIKKLQKPRDMARIYGIFLFLNIIYIAVVFFNIFQFILVWNDLL